MVLFDELTSTVNNDCASWRHDQASAIKFDCSRTEFGGTKTRVIADQISNQIWLLISWSLIMICHGGTGRGLSSGMSTIIKKHSNSALADNKVSFSNTKSFWPPNVVRELATTRYHLANSRDYDAVCGVSCYECFTVHCWHYCKS